MNPPNLEISTFNRYVVWVCTWGWYGGKVCGTCTFSNKDEAIKYAIMQAQGSVDWDKFPNPSKLYPNDDRNGANLQLTPIFRATWEGGFSQVEKVEVSDKFDFAASYVMKKVEEIFGEMK